MKRLKDKVALITGGGAGIGKATAELFVGEGARVMLVDLNEDALKAAILELGETNAAYCVADVSLSEDVNKYVQATLNAFGRIDVFFNNAGIEGNSFPLSEYPEALFDKVLAVNVKGVWLGCQHVLPRMSEGGSAIITSSVAGLKGMKGLGAYVTSKHAVIGIMRVAALEFAERKIRVNTVHPGPVNTNMMRRIEADVSPVDTQQARQGFESLVPLARYGEPGEIAELVLFLASDESKYISGNTYVIDGGMMAK
jgi:NAD(P)-dependent dehydrogenase (short-subunit alcohol dehydrogenase family)